MTDQHPITPPPELRAQWRKEAPVYRDCGVGREEWFIDRAAQWGADQELEACCTVLDGLAYEEAIDSDQLREARRPPAPSEADLALAALKVSPKTGAPTIIVDVEQYNTILRALQRLKELEGLNND